MKLSHFAEPARAEPHPQQLPSLKQHTSAKETANALLAVCSI